MLKRERDMIAKMLGRTLLTLILIVGTITSMLWATTVHADSTTYYINNQTGSNCNDANTNTGTNQASPWCDFTPVNSHTFGPGDHILLARRATWDQQITLTGSGSASNLAVVDAYGTGANPRIIRDGNANDRGIRMNDPSYWSINNLEIGHAGAGILIYYTTTGHAGLTFNNLYLHHIYGIHEVTSNADHIFDSSGIEFTGDVTISSTNPTILQNVLISNVEGTHNQDSIAFDWNNGSAIHISGTGVSSANAVQNVTIQSANLHNDDASGDVNPTCPESLRLTSMQNVLIYDSILNGEPSCGAPAGTASVFLAFVSNVSFTNDILANVPDTHSYDETTIDHEAATDQVHIRNSYIASNAGAGIEYLTIHPPSDLGGISDYSTNEEISGSIFANNGINNPVNSKGGIQRVGTTTVPTGVIRDNLYYEPAGFTHINGSGDFSGFTFTNNLGASSATNLYNAAYQFSSTQGSNQWSYQYTTNSGTSWTNLSTFDSSNGWANSAGSPFPRVQQFDMIPDACASCSTARAWTAPTSGIVSLRGRILKQDNTCGDGVVARITQNGNTIWGPQTITYNERVGVEANADNVVVSSGDVLRFVVNPGPSGYNSCDWTSWDPSVGYAPVFNRYYNSSTGIHWVTTDFTPGTTAGYTLEGKMGYLFTSTQPNTTELYGCHVNTRNDYFISPRNDCEGQTLLRVEGWIYTTAPSGITTSALYRCWTGTDHFVSFDSHCEGQTNEELLGYAPSQP